MLHILIYIVSHFLCTKKAYQQFSSIWSFLSLLPYGIHACMYIELPSSINKPLFMCVCQGRRTCAGHSSNTCTFLPLRPHVHWVLLYSQLYWRFYECFTAFLQQFFLQRFLAFLRKTPTKAYGSKTQINTQWPLFGVFHFFSELEHFYS